jgi:hypothetical protein
MMAKLRAAASLAIVIMATSCGGGNFTATPISTGASPVMSGNYQINAVSQLSGSFTISGFVQTTQGAISGTVVVSNPLGCFGDSNVPVQLSGAVQPNGQLSVTISSLHLVTVTLNATVSADGKTISNGTFTATGTPCGSGDHGTFSGFFVQPVAGLYTGSLSASGSTINISANLAQTTENFGAAMVLSGTANFSDSVTCGFASSSALSVQVGLVLGTKVSFLLQDNLSTVVLSFTGQVQDPTAHVIIGTYTITSGACGGQSGLLTLTHA